MDEIEIVWAPSELEIFIHHAVCGEPWHRPSGWYSEVCSMLCFRELLEHNGEGVLRATTLGSAFLRLLTRTPIPQPAFVDPRTLALV